MNREPKIEEVQEAEDRADRAWYSYRASAVHPHCDVLYATYLDRLRYAKELRSRYYGSFVHHFPATK